MKIYQLNVKTGDVTVEDYIKTGYKEITKKEYESLKNRNVKAQVETAYIDPETGDFGSKGGSFSTYDTEGNLKAKVGSDGSIVASKIGATQGESGLSFTPGQRPTVGGISTGSDNEVATISDVKGIKSGIQKISSTTLTVAGDLDNTTVELPAASKTKLGGIQVGDMFDISVDGLLEYTAKIASKTAPGVVRVAGGSTGIEIQEDGTVYVSGSASPFVYDGKWNPNTNIPALSDLVGNANHFYVCTEAGSHTFEHGIETFEKNDWVIYTIQYDTNGKPKADTGIWKCLPIGVYIPVTSVAGKTGDVDLDPVDVKLGNVKNVDTTNATNIKDGMLAAGVDTTKEIKTTDKISANGGEFTSRISFYKTV